MKLSPNISAGYGSAVIACGGNVVIGFSAGSGNGAVSGRFGSDVLDFSPGHGEVTLFELADGSSVTLDELLANATTIDSNASEDTMNQTTVTADETISLSRNDVRSDDNDFAFNFTPPMTRQHDPNSSSPSGGLAKSSRHKPKTENGPFAGKQAAASSNGSAERINYTSEEAIRALSKKFTKLTPEKEKELVRLARSNPRNLDRLVRHMMWLIIYHADKLAIDAKRSYFADFVQEGSIALLEAFKLYNPARATSFSTYAAGRVRGAILNYLLMSTAVVPLSEYAHRQSLTKKRHGAVMTRDCNSTEQQAACHDLLSTEQICTGSDHSPLFADESAALLKSCSDGENLKICNPIENIDDYVNELYSNDPCLCRLYLELALKDLLRTELTAREYVALSSFVFMDEESLSDQGGNDIPTNRIADTKYKARRKLSNAVVQNQLQELRLVGTMLNCGATSCMWGC